MSVRALPTSDRSTLRVLLVEDSAELAGILRLQLERSAVGPFAVEIRGSLRGALDRLGSGTPLDAVLLDLTLPDAEGLVTLTAVLANAPHLPVVVLSGAHDPDLRMEAIHEGAQDFVSKTDVRGEALALRLRFAVERDRRRVRLQQTIREARAEHMILRQILEHAVDGILVVDTDGVIRFANPSAARMFGRHTRDLVGSPFGHPVTASESAEIDVRGPGGRAGVAEIRAVETTWAGVPATVVSLRDVTEKKLVERMRQDLVAMLTHDIKSPLAAILGYAELLRTEPVSEEGKTAIDRIEANVDRATLLASNLVESVRIESGAVETRLEPVSVNDVVSRAIAAYDGAARREGVAIEARLDPGMPRSELDPALLDRAFVNLLSNAVRHSPHPGSVRVSTLHDARGVEVSVEDDGPGVPPAEQPRLFRRFSLLAGSGSGSSGLGLHIVRSFAEAQGGEVRYETLPAGGARFTLRFPVRGRAPHGSAS